VRLGVINLTHSSRAAIKFAQAAEAAGFWGVGIGDTVPERYQDTYVTAAACFAATERVHIGPTVTNTVTRHWSVLGGRSASSTPAGSSPAWRQATGPATRSA
jgi:alkanesulfonate monooxygenase SsuD/methylene tetrahydromethanopterin reductase-like flavin-dependent oxidoreductase (luciferase family)